MHHSNRMVHPVALKLGRKAVRYLPLSHGQAFLGLPSLGGVDGFFPDGTGLGSAIIEAWPQVCAGIILRDTSTYRYRGFPIAIRSRNAGSRLSHLGRPPHSPLQSRQGIPARSYPEPPVSTLAGRFRANTRASPSPARSQPVEYPAYAAQYRDTVAFEMPKCAIV